IVSAFGRAPRRRTLAVNASLPLQRARPLHRSLRVSRPRLSTAMLRLTRASRQDAPLELKASTPAAGAPPGAGAGVGSVGDCGDSSVVLLGFSPIGLSTSAPCAKAQAAPSLARSKGPPTSAVSASAERATS